MLTWMIYALIAVALLALLPFVVLGWWDVADRWRERGQKAGPEQQPGCGPPQKRISEWEQRVHMAALYRPKEGD